jgi:hypothetical protein
MYENPSIHFELAKQRHQDFLREAKKEALVREAVAELEPSDRLKHVRGVFAGIMAAVSGLTPRTRPLPRQPWLTPAS